MITTPRTRAAQPRSTTPATAGPTPAAPAVELQDLRKSFRGKDGPIVGVDGVDLSIGHGEIVAFLGPNGAGKTTTLDMLLRLVEPDSCTTRVVGTQPRAAAQAGPVSDALQTGGLL